MAETQEATKHRTGTRDEWLAAREELTKLENEQAERNEEIKKKRLELPWVPVEKEYEFETEDGGLADPVETRPAKPDNPPPSSKAWTHRFKESGKPAEYELFDQVWLSPSLANRQTGAFIDRRTKHSGDGSDHEPAWVVVDL